MPTIRTTMRPDLEVEVSDADYTDLKRQGLLLEDTDQPPVATAATTKKAAQPAVTKEG